MDNQNDSQSISCLCFSKDRPLQCEGFIQSLKANASVPVKLSILYATKNESYQKAYDLLQDLYPDVDFIKEENLRRHVTKWVKNNPNNYLMFGCDDVVYKKCFNTETIVKAFSENSNLQGFSLRLGNDIYYSAMHLCIAKRPIFIKKSPYLLWDWREKSSNHDWAFPFELNCTVYKKTLCSIY